MAPQVAMLSEEEVTPPRACKRKIVTPHGACKRKIAYVQQGMAYNCIQQATSMWMQKQGCYFANVVPLLDASWHLTPLPCIQDTLGQLHDTYSNDIVRCKFTFDKKVMKIQPYTWNIGQCTNAASQLVTHALAIDDPMPLEDIWEWCEQATEHMGLAEFETCEEIFDDMTQTPIVRLAALLLQTDWADTFDVDCDSSGDDEQPSESPQTFRDQIAVAVMVNVLMSRI